MKFQSFTWPCNPTKLQITAGRNQKLFVLPFGGEAVQDLGRAGREIAGEGVFSGEEAEETCRALENLIHTNPLGTLVLPQGISIDAYFCSFTYGQDAFPDYFSYSFVFREVL